MIAEAYPTIAFEVTRLAADSRAVKPGDTFVAYPGEKVDGRQFIANAVAAGANGVIWEPKDFTWPAGINVPNQAIPDLRERLGYIANDVYGEPSQQLWVVGVTGTNGKTSVAHWIAQSLTHLGKKTAIMGTLGNGFYGKLAATANTTSDAISNHAHMREFLDEGADAIAMEVSSHGLVQGRVNAVAFNVAVLTNLSRDHLDYHGTMSVYERAKAKLFSWPQLGYAVLNADDGFGAKLAANLHASSVEKITYGIALKADVRGQNLIADAKGISLEVRTPWGSGLLQAPLIGRFNASNALATLSTLLVSGISLTKALGALNFVRPVPGRMETMGGNGAPLIVIDYAHTPDALEKVLTTLREILAPGAKLACVFGCGGERDTGKRPLMGEIATRLAHHTIITSDNPRRENPLAIIKEISSGAKGDYEVIENRAEAIAVAIGQAAQNDIVLIAGKGHELYQEINGVKLPFDDTTEAAAALRLRGLN